MGPDFQNSIERIAIDQIAPGLRLFSRQQNAYKFLCPYCQTGLTTDKGKPYTKGDAKGHFYQKGNTWNFKCHKSKCPTHTQELGGKSFEKFLSDHFPKQHLEYVRRRDELGLTGYQTNCPTLQTVLKDKGILDRKVPEFGSTKQRRKNAPPSSPSAQTAQAGIAVDSNVTYCERMRSPQQQAGHQSPLNHLMKQYEKRKRREPGDDWLC